MRSICQGLLLGFTLGIGFPLAAATYEVAQRHPQASDDAPGTSAHPWKTLSHAAEHVRPGDTVLIHGGVYRERVRVPACGTAEAPICFKAAPGEGVVLTGADQLRDWQQAGDSRPIYQVPWTHRFVTWNPSMTHPNDAYHRLIGRCEQVVADGYLLRQVLNHDQIAPGTFFVDVNRQRLHVWDIGGRNLNRVHVEASVRQEVFRVEGDHVHLRGLRFRYAANMAQHGAVVLAGDHNRMEDCVVETMNATGATFSGEDAVVRRSVFRNNGQMGFGASSAHHLLLAECQIENNNTKGFDRGWEAGGNKLVLCRDVVLERSRFLRNRGSGIWFDIGNSNCTVRQCFIADNEDAGIFYEISHGLTAQDNVIVGNGFASTAGAWGAQAGISLSSSPGCLIERNLIVGNREGFNFREQLRTSRTIEDRVEHAVWNHDEIIRHNLIAYNRDAQVWGWFDVKDNRHWPAKHTTPDQTTLTPRPPAGDIAAGHAPRARAGQPVDLTLEGLRLRFERNIYFAAPGQGAFAWGPTWARHEYYPNLQTFQSDLGIDTQSRVLEPEFADALQLDFRLGPAAPPELKACVPRAPVPGVTLDVDRL